MSSGTAEQPTTITLAFLFTDVVGSTALWQRSPDAMGRIMARHDALLASVVAEHGGRVFKKVGDAVCAAFPTVSSAAQAAVAGQRALAAERWGESGRLRVRMAVHVGAVEERGGDFAGMTLNRLSRLVGVAHGGQILLSSVARELARERLPDDLTLRDLGEHRLKDLQAPERIHQLGAPGLQVEFPPLESLDARPNNLPIQATPFVGRDADVTAVRDLLTRPDVRLLTLTGAGGTGKTRLALQVAADVAESFGGVYFVDLSPITDPELVASTVAQALGLQESGPQTSRQLLADHLCSRRALLVLDNFEQVLAGASVVSDILSYCPQVKVLVTSRARLQLRGEHEYVVPPLGLPEFWRVPSVERVREFDALRLFVDRAVALRPDFSVTERNVGAIAEICRRLDGLPLAIELAAGRIKVLTPEAMLAWLDRRLALLRGGVRDVPDRQRTLTGAVEWSHDLLEPGERKLFRRIGVFSGGASLEALEALTDLGDLEMDVLEGLASLADKSLLRAGEGTDGEPRFTMLQTIREYAIDRLAHCGELEQLRERHARWFGDLAEQSIAGMRGEGQRNWLARLEEEHDNLRAALEWAIGHGDADLAHRLSVWPFWLLRGHVTEGRRWLDRILALEPGGTPRWRARTLNGAGYMAQQQRDMPRARELLQQALETYRAIGDEDGVAAVLSNLGVVEQNAGEYDRAVELHEQSLELKRRSTNRREVAISLVNLAGASYLQGNLPRVRELLEECLAMQRDLRDHATEVLALGMLGWVMRRSGNRERAIELCEQALEMAVELGALAWVGSLLSDRAALAVGEWDAETVAVVWGAAHGFLDRTNAPLETQVLDEQNALLQPARDELGADAWGEAVRRGREMSLEEGVELARSARLGTS